MEPEFLRALVPYASFVRNCLPTTLLNEHLRLGAFAVGRFDPGTEGVVFLAGECAAHHIFDEVGSEGCLRVRDIRCSAQRVLAPEQLVEV